MRPCRLTPIVIGKVASFDGSKTDTFATIINFILRMIDRSTRAFLADTAHG